MPRPVSLSPELLQTFVSVVLHDGDAVAAADELGINQPSMSKRLAILQHSGRVLRTPWLTRKGKNWQVTEEGRRIFPTVEDLVRRYEQLRKFASSATPAGLAIACGQDAVAGVILAAAREFRKTHPSRSFRISTPRGDARIEGVAGGKYNLALVTHEPAQIDQISRLRLHVEDLYSDPLVLAVSPRAPFADGFAKLADAAVTARVIASFPMVLPQPDSGLRKPFDERMQKEGYMANAVVECGGWPALLEYVKEGFGVGLLPRSVAAREPKLLIKAKLGKLATPNIVRLICRLRHSPESGLDLTEDAASFRAALLAEVAKNYRSED